MACPAPVITVKKALEEHSELQVLLDNGAPRENVSRFARNRGYQLCEEQADSGSWIITITHDNESPKTTSANPDEHVMIISSCFLGNGPEELGKLLIKNLIHTLLETANQPARMLFLNSGVFLTTKGSDVLEALEKLEGMGVEILSCGLCLDFFDLKDKIGVGGTTNMLSIADNLLNAAQVVKL
jgi:selenium metabolism protein YedF